jgi:hypothetical protein
MQRRDGCGPTADAAYAFDRYRSSVCLLAIAMDQAILQSGPSANGSDMADEIWRCDDCGRWVNSGEIHDECDSHDVQCWVDFEIRMFLATSQGKFEIFYARRRLP